MTTLNLHTGLPGASKTLFTIDHVLKLTAQEQKEADAKGQPYQCEVYFFNIRGCKVPGWIELEDAKKWHDLPVGSIIIIDEAQDIFRPRGNGSIVPEHVAQLEKHRHKGFRLFLITQHPMLLDNNVRRLVTKHRHMVRAFGKHFATAHEWDKCKEQCDKNREDSIKTAFPYPKHVFDLYQSAELHVIKGKFPWRVTLLVLLPVLLAICVYMAYSWFAARSGGDNIKKSLSTPTAPGAGPAGSREGSGPIGSPRAYFEKNIPRIAGLPETAPIYDEITTPVQAPYAAMCVKLEKQGCRCYTQQATRIDTSPSMCESIAQNGYFVAWDTQKGRDQRQAQPVAAAQREELHTNPEAPRPHYTIERPPRFTLSDSATKPKT